MNGTTVRRAAIDIGTVTTRLLVADVTAGDLAEVVRRTVVTQLGEGLHATGRLSDAAIDRVAATYGTYLDEARDLGAVEIVAVATSAARDAKNGREFLERLGSLGIRPRIISGSTEARLSFTGATYALEDDGILVADLGGGSTELILGSSRSGDEGRAIDIEAARSFDVGSRRVLDMFLHTDPPTHAEQVEATAWVVEEMRPYFDALRARPGVLITLAGTGTTLSAIQQQLQPYDPAKVHGSELTGADVTALLEELAAMTVEERRGVVGMDPARADVIVAGALILQAILSLAGLDSTIVSEHDILYGLALEGAQNRG